MDKIFLFARDPGGANVIIPIIKELQKRNCNLYIYGKDIALERFRRVGIIARNINLEVENIDQKSIEALLRKLNPQLVITGTSADDYTEKFIWKSAEKLNIFSFAVLDQWMNYGIRFSKYSVNEIEKYENKKTHEYLPRKILVMDEYAKIKVEEEGIDSSRVLVTGQPYFDYLLQNSSKIKPEIIDDYKSKIKLEKDEKLLVYASEPLSKTYGNDESCQDYWGYTEKTNFKEICEVLSNLIVNSNTKFRVLVKLHPKEDLDSYENLAKQLAKENLNIVIEGIVDPMITMMAADLIIGMSSMFLLEAVNLGKTVASVQIGLKRDNPFILDKIGKLKTITNIEDLKKYFEKIDQTQTKIDFEIHRGSIIRIIDCLEENSCQKN